MGFDAAGNLVYQQVKYDFNPNTNSTTYPGQVFQAPITGSGNPITVGSPTTLSLNTAGYDLAVASDHNIYATGAGGLFQINPATNAITPFDDTNTTIGAESLSFLARGGSFSPFAGPNGGQLAYIPDYQSATINIITPASVPEPSSWALAAAGGAALLWGVRRRK